MSVHDELLSVFKKIEPVSADADHNIVHSCFYLVRLRIVDRVYNRSTIVVPLDLENEIKSGMGREWLRSKFGK